MEGAAQLEAGHISGSVDLAAPAGGINAVRFADRRVADALLGVQLDPNIALSLVESHIRASDLVAGYTTGDGKTTLSVCWSVASCSEDIAALDLIVSINTDLMESRQRLLSHSVYAGEWSSTWRDDAGAAGAVIIKSSATQLGMIELPDTPHEPDVRQETEGRCVASWKLCDGFLEKGVIRRARLRSVLIAASEEATDSRAARLFSELVELGPPLTA